jgi:hypothetical protein
MPPAKKTSRPRLDAVIRHIKDGSYDDDMSQLKGAIEDRQRHRQDAVANMVKQVFGDDYEVVPSVQAPLRPSPFANTRPRPGGPVDPDLKAAEQAALEAEKRLAEELGATPDPLGDDPEEGIESRSPLIGSIDPSAEPQPEEPGGVTIEVVEGDAPETEETELRQERLDLAAEVAERPED